MVKALARMGTLGALEPRGSNAPPVPRRYREERPPYRGEFRWDRGLVDVRPELRLGAFFIVGPRVQAGKTGCPGTASGRRIILADAYFPGGSITWRLYRYLDRDQAGSSDRIDDPS